MFSLFSPAFLSLCGVSELALPPGPSIASTPMAVFLWSETLCLLFLLREGRTRIFSVKLMAGTRTSLAGR